MVSASAARLICIASDFNFERDGNVDKHPRIVLSLLPGCREQPDNRRRRWTGLVQAIEFPVL
jgi:hypothetical protein